MAEIFVRRDGDGRIIAVSRERIPEVSEPLDADGLELLEFLQGSTHDPVSALRASDLEFIRVLEDLIEVLITRGVIQFTDLPDAAQDKLLGRKSLRQSDGFTLSDEDDALI